MFAMKMRSMGWQGLRKWGEVLFQALLLDDVSIENSSILAKEYTVYISK